MKPVMITAVCAMGAFLPTMTMASAIDFETGFSDNEVLTPTSFAAEGVVFSTINPDEPGLSLAVEAMGDADAGPQGFVRDESSSRDEVDPGLEGQIGNYFLRTGGEIEDRNFASEAVFRIAFTDIPGQFISGEIWDIDGNASQGSEGWRIDAYNAAGDLIGNRESPIGETNGAGSLDGDVWSFEFTDTSMFVNDVDVADVKDVARLDFVFIGTKTTGIGLAFDNFTWGEPPSVVPVPGSLPLLLAGVGGAAFFARRRSQKKAR